MAERKLFVEYGCYKSDFFNASSGVSQGSNLDPLLFLLFLNDISNNISVPHLFVPDYLKINKKIEWRTVSESLQETLNSIVLNNIRLNVTKCKIMTFCVKNNTIELNNFIENSISERCMEIKDVEVIFDSKLTFNTIQFRTHISTLCSKATRMIGYLMRKWKSFYDLRVLKFYVWLLFGAAWNMLV